MYTAPFELASDIVSDIQWPPNCLFGIVKPMLCLDRDRVTHLQQILDHGLLSPGYDKDLSVTI